MSQACRNVSTSKEPSSGLKNFIRFSDARLQARVIDEHILGARVRRVDPVRSFLTGFHLLIVVSYCIPGSPQTHAASAIFAISSRALDVL